MTSRMILVQIADPKWTAEAVHQACLLARETSAKVALACLIPVQHAAWLGTDSGYMDLTDAMQADFEEYQAAIEDYGVECVPLLFQYADMPEALAQAAEHVHAEVVFAKVRPGIIPLWAWFQSWRLGRSLARLNCRWIESVFEEITTSEALAESAHDTGLYGGYQSRLY